MKKFHITKKAPLSEKGAFKICKTIIYGCHNVSKETAVNQLRKLLFLNQLPLHISDLPLIFPRY